MFFTAGNVVSAFGEYSLLALKIPTNLYQPLFDVLEFVKMPL